MRPYLAPRQQQELVLTGGMTESVFVDAELLLNSDTDYWNALSYVASNKDTRRYRSAMDFLFVHIALSPWYTRCMAFYADKSKKRLVDWLSRDEIKRWDARLVDALEMAVVWFRQDRQDSWTQFRLEALAKGHQAAT